MRVVGNRSTSDHTPVPSAKFETRVIIPKQQIQHLVEDQGDVT